MYRTRVEVVSMAEIIRQGENTRLENQYCDMSHSDIVSRVTVTAVALHCSLSCTCTIHPPCLLSNRHWTLLPSLHFSTSSFVNAAAAAAAVAAHTLLTLCDLSPFPFLIFYRTLMFQLFT